MRVYADNAATTAMSRTAIDAMLPYFDNIYGNPSSLHSLGQAAKEALDATIFMVTHDSFAASFCDRVIILQDGQVWRTLERGGTQREDFQDLLLDAIREMGKE